MATAAASSPATAGGLCYQRREMGINPIDGKTRDDDSTGGWKRRRVVAQGRSVDFFDGLPDDLVVSILTHVSSSATAPSDLINILITCKRMNALGRNPLILSKASAKCLAVRAGNWSESGHRFLKRCAEAGNLEACYTLGMIEFYCLESRWSGASLIARAASGLHAGALFSLAVMQFNGSGGSKNDRDLRAGVALCARAAVLGHVDALRELGHCLQDGYGVAQNVSKGRRFLIHANAVELAAVANDDHHHHLDVGLGCPLLSDYGYDVPAREAHPGNRFLVEWFGAARGGARAEELRVCSHSGCGRPETRRHEFRRCSVCGAVSYCSRACQALHWKLAHKFECAPMARWPHDGAVDAAAEDDFGVPADDGGDGVK